MRIREILVEYSRKKTAKQWGQAAWEKLDEEADDTPFAEELLNMYDTPEKLLSWMETKDPTKDKKYTEWIARQYVKNGIQRIEDIDSRIPALLRYHNRLASSDRIEGNNKNIDSFKSITQLEDFIEEYYVTGTSDSDELGFKGEQLVDSDKAEIVYNGPDYRIVIPKSYEASCYFGSGTRWCTAMSTTSRHWNEYSREGTFYYITDKNQNTKYAINFGAKAYFDEKDREVSPKTLYNNHPKLINKIIKYEGGAETVAEKDPSWYMVLEFPDMSEDEKEYKALWGNPKDINHISNPTDNQKRAAILGALYKRRWSDLKLILAYTNIRDIPEDVQIELAKETNSQNTEHNPMLSVIAADAPNVTQEAYKILFNQNPKLIHSVVTILTRSNWKEQPQWPTISMLKDAYNKLPQHEKNIFARTIMGLIENNWKWRDKVTHLRDIYNQVIGPYE